MVRRAEFVVVQLSYPILACKRERLDYNSNYVGKTVNCYCRLNVQCLMLLWLSGQSARLTID